MRLGPVKTETSGPRTAQTLLREAMVRRRKAIIPAALAAAFSALSLKYLPLPYAWIALAWAAACIVGFSASTHAVARTLLVNLAVVWLALGAAEAYARFALNGGEGIAPTYTEGYRLRDRILGMVPPKAIVARSKRVIQGSPIFDATYTIGANRLRIPPPDRGSAVRGCVLFFGCSFTFGEGLQDADTLPYQVGIASQGSFRTYNFGFHGYGPHQMLAALEHGLVGQAIDCQPSHIIYQALPDHVARVSGLYSWGKHHPRYHLNPDGTVNRRGSFSDENITPGSLSRNLQYQLGKSSLFNWVEAQRLALPSRPINGNDIDLFLGIVSQAQREAARRFPASQFHVVLWPWQTQITIYDAMLEGLKKAQIRTHPVTEFLSDYRSNPMQYAISPLDQHPNARANQLMAAGIVQKILEAQVKETEDGAKAD